MGWLSGWSYRRKITITEQSGSSLTDYQVKVDLTDYTLTDAASDGADIRFTEDDGTTLLSFWREEYEGSSSGQKKIFWVKVPSIPASGTTDIYVYYANPSASDASSGEDTFAFFDGFEDGDVSDWTTNEYGTWEATTTSKHGTYGARGAQTSTSSNWSTYKPFGVNLEDGYAYTLWVRTDDAANVYKYIVTHYPSADSKVMLALRLGYITYNDGEWHNLVSITSDTWYKIELRNFTDSGYDIYVDDTLKQSQAGYKDPDGYTDHAHFRGTYAYPDGDIYVDSVIVRKFVDPEPSISVGDEEESAGISLSISTSVTSVISKILSAVRFLSISTSVSSTLQVTLTKLISLLVSTTPSTSLSRKFTGARSLLVSTSVSTALQAQKVVGPYGLPDFTYATGIVAQTIDYVDVNLKAQSISRLDVNIADVASDADFSVYTKGGVNLNIYGQGGELDVPWALPTGGTPVYVSQERTSAGETTVYTVPTGRTFWLVHYSIGVRADSSGNSCGGYIKVVKGANTYYFAWLPQYGLSGGGVSGSPSMPMPFDEGTSFVFGSTGTGVVNITIMGFETTSLGLREIRRRLLERGLVTEDRVKP